MFDKLGHECCACGYSNKRALQLDHINDNGAEERRTMSMINIYKRATGEHSDEYQILCANCNQLKKWEVYHR